MTRRSLDAYRTDEILTDVLIDQLGPLLSGVVFEPCVGDGAIAHRLRAHYGDRVQLHTNDVDLAHPADTHLDATTEDAWQVQPALDWTVTNPPFSFALPILRRALHHSRRGVALLLRLSFLEPTKQRAALLTTCPPTRVCVTPRFSFTGDGRHDSVTTAWLVWLKDAQGQVVRGTVRVAPRLQEAAR